MELVTAAEAERTFMQLLDRDIKGESFGITIDGRVVAVFSPWAGEVNGGSEVDMRK